ncbi:MAG: ABC-type transport auxiliary lipoprotein family protein [Pseudohongiella sp.]|nr:ABC-type transport auxiliary lipoprotein family protein [Pseudohongiella sp.]MDP2129015.1 ABC-type transport auxiliary lipoprotein family protein [Pseudohongiella sp.]
MKIITGRVTRSLTVKNVAAIVASLLISACSVLPAREPVDLFQLPASSISSNQGSTIPGGLRLLTPDTSDALSGSRLLILDNNIFQAWPASRWAAPLPQLWRDWLLDAFWRDGRFGSLSTDSTVLQAERSINGMMRAMHTENIDGRMIAVIRFDAQLVNTSGRQIIAARRFESREPLNGSSAHASVVALGVAADRLARELIDWAVTESSR